ncbi:MAG: F0F1 ATP synthase subunit A [Acidimicrobiales bacterium]
MKILALEFPPVEHLFIWPDFAFDGTPVAINKTVVIYLLAMILTGGLFIWAGARKQMVPTGITQVAEGGINFVQTSIVDQTMGPDGKKYVPFLTTMFFFIFFVNIFEVIPFMQFPGSARMAMPLALAIMVWCIYNFLGIKHQGLGGYLKNSLFPPGVPVALYVIVTPIEFFSVFIIRPLSLAIRLWANMVAGHLLLVTFAVLSATLWESTYIAFILPYTMLILMTGFEILVSFLQAFIFTILTAVYMGGAIHPEH